MPFSFASRHFAGSDEGIFINMLRSKIVKQALQQGFSSRSRWLLQILGLKVTLYTE
jgi:hypothetical protein